MKNCRLVSDLHLFSKRSQGERHQSAIERAAAEADAFVLAGDNFDFHWSTLGPVDESAAQAERWLERLASRSPNCRFHVLLGNHDSHPALMRRLESLQSRLPNFEWQPYFVRIGSSVFLHGDAANWRMNAARLSCFRRRCATSPRRGVGMARLYDIAIRARLHVLCARVAYPHRVVARRLIAYLDEIGHGAATGVRNVYFGHTHRALNDYEYKGLRFHNCGAPIDGVPFSILEAEIS